MVVCLVAAGMALGAVTMSLAKALHGTEEVSSETSQPYEMRREWSPSVQAAANISAFVFRDANRSGEYDIGDRPMSGILVVLSRPDGTRATRRSNIHGFANFTNALSELDLAVDIDSAGDYRLEVLVPDAWRVTSNNAVQMVRFREDRQSRPGLVVS